MRYLITTVCFYSILHNIHMLAISDTNICSITIRSNKTILFPMYSKAETGVTNIATG